MKIKYKLIIAFVLMSLIIILISGSILFIQAKNVMTNKIQSNLESINHLKANQFKYHLEKQVENIEVISDLLSLNGPNESIDSQKIDDFIKNYVSSNVGFNELFILDNSGKIILSTSSSQKNKIKAVEDFFIEGKKKTYIQNLYFDLALQKGTLIISTPLNDEGGNVVGVLAGRVNLNEVSKIFLEQVGLGKNGETYLINKFNYLVSDSIFFKNSQFKKSINHDAVEQCIKSKGKGGLKYVNHRGVYVFGSYQWISEMDLCVISEEEVKDSLKSTNSLKLAFIIISIIMICLSIFFANLISKLISNNLNVLTEIIEHISVGKTDVEIPKNLMGSKDEIGKLASAFDRTLISLKLAMKDSYPELKKMSDGLKDALDENKRTLDSIMFSEEKYRKIFEVAQGGIILTDLDSQKIISANPAICNVLGYKEKELKELFISQIFPRNDLRSIISEYNELIKTNNLLVKNLPFECKNKEITYLTLRVSVIMIRGKKYYANFFSGFHGKTIKKNRLKK